MGNTAGILLTISTFVGITGCTAMRQFLLSDYGVPLTDYQAQNGRYFPAFVHKVFPSSRQYEQDYPTIAEARAGIKMISVRQLNDRPGYQNEANLSWSADGAYLSFESVQGSRRRIMVKDLAGNYSRSLLKLPASKNTFLNGLLPRSIHSYNAGLSWSRDSTRYAFMSNGGTGNYNIYVGAVGTRENPVSKSPSKDGYATWSPVKNEIAFVSGRSGNGDIYLLNLDSRQLTRLSRTAAVDLFPEWSPDGQSVIWSSEGARGHHLMMATRTSGRWLPPAQLTRWHHDDLRPTVSPDGRYVAFYSNSGRVVSGRARWNIHVIPIRSKPWTRAELPRMLVARDVVVDLNTGPAWSPDSKRLFYVKKDPVNFNPIYGYDLFTGRRYALKTNTRMNRDILISRLGVLSFRAQVGAWDKVFVALTNQGLQLQGERRHPGSIHYLSL